MKWYLRGMKLVEGSWLLGGNMLGSVNTWAVSVVRYSDRILEWNDIELKAIDVKTQNFLTMTWAFQMKSSVDRLYMKRLVGSRGLISMEECAKAEELGLINYVADSKG